MAGLLRWRKSIRDFGAGIEVSLLAAVPKGSGLGTSSILAATVLAALGDLCGLDWDRNTLFTRTSALEQMLTTGGGWRARPARSSAASNSSRPSPAWCRSPLLAGCHTNYSITTTPTVRSSSTTPASRASPRTSSVRSCAASSSIPRPHLGVIADIGANADFAAAAIQKCDYDMLLAAIRNSWTLNQRLDAGTNPAEVQADPRSRRMTTWAPTKLLGAGGGGYLLLFGKDETAAARIKQLLTSDPPNARARFVDFSLSQTGLRVNAKLSRQSSPVSHTSCSVSRACRANPARQAAGWRKAEFAAFP